MTTSRSFVLELVLERVAVKLDEHLGERLVFAQRESGGEDGVAGDPGEIWGLLRAALLRCVRWC